MAPATIQPKNSIPDTTAIVRSPAGAQVAIGVIGVGCRRGRVLGKLAVPAPFTRGI